MTTNDRYAEWSHEVHRDLESVRAEAKRARKKIVKQYGWSTGWNKTIGAETDERGILDRLVLTPQAMRLGPERLAEEIVACCKRAAEDVDKKVAKIMRDMTDDPQLRSAAAEFTREFFGEEEPPLRKLTDDEYFERFQQDPLGRRRSR